MHSKAPASDDWPVGRHHRATALSASRWPSIKGAALAQAKCYAITSSWAHPLGGAVCLRNRALAVLIRGCACMRVCVCVSAATTRVQGRAAGRATSSRLLENWKLFRPSESALVKEEDAMRASEPLRPLRLACGLLICMGRVARDQWPAGRPAGHNLASALSLVRCFAVGQCRTKMSARPSSSPNKRKISLPHFFRAPLRLLARLSNGGRQNQNGLIVVRRH